MAQTITLEFLTELLVHAGLLTGEHQRDAILRYDRERALLVRARQGSPGAGRKGGASDAGVHPAEVLAVMALPTNGNANKPLGERVIMMALARHLNLPFVDLDPLKIDAKLAPQVLSRPFARRHGALVIAVDDVGVTVAVADPLNRELTDDLVTHVRKNPKFVISTPTDIQRLITDFYGFRGAVAAAEEQVAGGVDIGNLERYVRLKRVEEIEATDSHIVAAVEYLLHYALDQRASDIHIEPRREQSVVRMRIDGVLHAVHTLPKGVHAAT